MPILIDQIELAHIFKIGAGKTPSKFVRQSRGEFYKDPLSILCPLGSTLFVINDPVTDFIIGENMSKVDPPGNDFSSIKDQFSDLNK